MADSVRARVQKRLQDKGMARAELSRRLEESDRNVENWLTGKARMPVAFLEAFLREVPTNADWLLTGRGSPEPTTEGEAQVRLRLVREALDRPLGGGETLEEDEHPPVPRKPGPGRRRA